MAHAIYNFSADLLTGNALASAARGFNDAVNGPDVDGMAEHLEQTALIPYYRHLRARFVALHVAFGGEPLTANKANEIIKRNYTLAHSDHALWYGTDWVRAAIFVVNLLETRWQNRTA